MDIFEASRVIAAKKMCLKKAKTIPKNPRGQRPIQSKMAKGRYRCKRGSNPRPMSKDEEDAKKAHCDVKRRAVLWDEIELKVKMPSLPREPAVMVDV